ncbi:MAG: hypothetical protein HRU28_04225 [Rhizobiales bacterium]|nr:hypothetical protein [Hyphomicrobiales bacterium]
MRITNQNRAASVSKKRNTKKTSGTDGDFQPVADEDVSEVNVAAPLSPMQPVAAVDSLLAVQEMDQKKQQETAVNNSREMLSILQEIRVGLLSGHISEHKVEALSALASKERQTFGNADLNNVLDEIDLRARVELAKMQYR